MMGGIFTQTGEDGDKHFRLLVGMNFGDGAVPVQLLNLLTEADTAVETQLVRYFIARPAYVYSV